MRILIASDAWLPQINGVVRTLMTTRQELEKLGHVVECITPDSFRSMPCPTYPEIRLALTTSRTINERVEKFQPDCIHIATEGPLGLLVRRCCVKTGLAFTTSFHTKFPEYIKARFGIPRRWTYSLLRWFHRPSTRTMVATPSLKNELEQWGFEELVYWSRGVDTNLFRPRGEAKGQLEGEPPYYLYVGRVAVEKNIEAYLQLDLPGTKYIVGDGPQLAMLRDKYPNAHFVGAKTGEELAHYYSASDVFVFPSLTDTFGLVTLEAMASGLPVAAYPVTGPLDVIGDSGVGVLHDDLSVAVEQALKISAQDCREYAMRYAWQNCTEQFLGNLTNARSIAVI